MKDVNEINRSINKFYFKTERKERKIVKKKKLQRTTKQNIITTHYRRKSSDLLPIINRLIITKTKKL